MSNVIARLEALAASPRSWRVTTHYASGATRFHDTHTLAGAKNYATGEARALGRDLISRVTGETVRIVKVTVTKIGGAL